MRIGQGFDAHRYTPGRRLVLGGVEIPYEAGLEAHSDGDVAIHALCDALLGAAGLGDIGRHFPDTSADYKNIDSRVLLRNVIEKLKAQGFRVSNADITIVAQRPKLAPFMAEMQQRLASDMNIPVQRINVKATTTEGMGYTGRGEGVAAYAVALIDHV